MTDGIYQADIMAAAESAIGKGRLEAPQFSTTYDNPLCGDRITVDVSLDAHGDVERIGHVVRGCLLCEASASLLAQVSIGAPPARVHDIAQAIGAFLKRSPDIEAGLPSYAQAFVIFEPVSAHKSRHDCVLLPFYAFAQAFSEAKD